MLLTVESCLSCKDLDYIDSFFSIRICGALVDLKLSSQMVLEMTGFHCFFDRPVYNLEFCRNDLGIHGFVISFLCSLLQIAIPSCS